MGDVKIFTALHEYEQLPSKVCNSFLNRLYRNHYPRLYDDEYLKNLPQDYKKALGVAFDFFACNNRKESMDFLDFKHLDSGFSEIKVDDYEKLYDFYKSKYDQIHKKFQPL